MAKKLRYVGGEDGGFIRGIPARDLDDDDLKALPDGVGPKTLVKTGLYAEVGGGKDEPAAKPEAKE
jgi:hypothetical protein